MIVVRPLCGFRDATCRRAVENDVFHILDNDGATGDASNINALIALQRLMWTAIFLVISGYFQCHVDAGWSCALPMMYGSSEAGRDAALELMSFTGVNLDEAAALLNISRLSGLRAGFVSRQRIIPDFDE